jgi:hypothetical protein
MLKHLPGKQSVLSSSSRTQKYFHSALQGIADRLLTESKVNVSFHTKALDVIVSGSRIECILVADKEGVRAVQPKVVIDCTGDGNISAWAGVPFDIDNDPEPTTLEFYIGNVRIPKDRQELQNKCSQVFDEAYQK